MPGEIWREVLGIAKEATYGVYVAATRKIYPNNPKLTRMRDAHNHDFATGTRVQRRDLTLGPVKSDGSFDLDLSADELIEPLLMLLQGGVTPTTPASMTLGRLWNFKENNVVDSASIEHLDGGIAWKTTGCRVAKLTIKGKVTGQITASVEFFNKDKTRFGSTAITAATNTSPIVLTATGNGLTTGDTVIVSGVVGNTAANGQWTVTVSGASVTLVGSAGNGTYVSGGLVWSTVTAGLTDRVPTFMEGWESRLYIDALGATPRTTLIGGTMTEFEIVIEAALGRKYTADNTLSLNSIVLGIINTSCKIKMEAVAAQAYTEYQNWDAETGRLVGFEFGMNEQLESSPTNEVQTLTPGGTLSGGTYALNWKGQQTAALAHTATAATVQAALEALPAIGVGNVAVAGGPLSSGAMTITFQGALAGHRYGTAVTGFTTYAITVTNNLTGASPTVTPSQTTPGVGGKRTVTVDLPCKWRKFDLTGEDEGTRSYEIEGEGIYDATNAFIAQARCINTRTAAW